MVGRALGRLGRSAESWRGRSTRWVALPVGLRPPMGLGDDRVVDEWVRSPVAAEPRVARVAPPVTGSRRRLEVESFLPRHRRPDPRKSSGENG
ncbi:hypothetical protein C1701_01780 [Actinoalloteichus sp. AHMU CJ021]|nr:hypothetical protein C1701_01780 [Actinoalloteichus sp. AHMU CJ021]